MEKQESEPKEPKAVKKEIRLPLRVRTFPEEAKERAEVVIRKILAKERAEGVVRKILATKLKDDDENVNEGKCEVGSEEEDDDITMEDADDFIMEDIEENLIVQVGHWNGKRKFIVPVARMA